MFQTAAPRRGEAESESNPTGELDLGRRSRSRFPLRVPTRGTDGRSNLGDAEAPTRRRPLVAGAGVLVVVVCTALGAIAGGRSSSRVAYLEMARFVPQGAMLTAADLESSTLAPLQGLAVLPTSDVRDVVGRYATVSLVPGTLLAAADVSSLGPLSPGEALVGAVLAGDQLPPTLAVGDRVLVVLGGQTVGAPTAGSPTSSTGSTGPAATAAGGTGSAGSPAGPGGSNGHASATTTGALGGAAGDAVLATGTVTDLFAGGSSTGNAEVVGIEVPSADASAVAQASAAGDVSLAEISRAPRS